MEIANETAAKKPKRLTSVVWNHFERIRKGDTCYAVCVHCKKKLSGSSNSGTTHLRNHLIRCLKRSNYDVSQILSAKRKRKESAVPVSVANLNYEEGQRKDEAIIPMGYKFDHEQKRDESIKHFASVSFDQERSRLDLARMIMLHGYPLALPEHLGFKIFVKNLQPLFQLVSDTAIELDCMTIYGKEKQKVFEMIQRFYGRISLSLDTWTSPENVGFLSLTAYYIDESWKMQKKILNFITLNPSHNDDMLFDAVIKCFMDWEIGHKLFSVAFDDFSIHDDIVFRIRDWLSEYKAHYKNGQLFDLRFDVRCASHAIKSISQDAVEALRDVIQKVRESVKFVKSSQATQGKFAEIVQQLEITSEKQLFLDGPMRWDSTHLMLEAALDYRAAFSLLQEHDPTYVMALSDDEWDWATSVAGFMKLFVEVIGVFSSNKHPTANIYFPELCAIYIQLIDWCKNPDDFISSIALKMKAKFEKYWNKCSLALAIAAILDPRFKLKLVEYYYLKIYDDDAPDRIKDVSNGLRELFNEYPVGSTSVDEGLSQLGSGLPSSSNGTRDRLRDFDKFLHETSQDHSIMSDLEKYLEEPIFPRNYEFNILNWWKVHTPRYPILSMMARDVLAIPVSNISPEFAFSTGVRVLDHHRSSLTPDTRQALICGQDWLQTGSAEADLSSMHSALSLYTETS